MLLNVNVKNLALIKESDIYFKDGMNILTGETGAGKSIIIGSINIALGGKINKEMIRQDSDNAMVELVFKVDKEATRQKLIDIGVSLDDDEVVITRKLVNGRSVTKVNGETFSVTNLKEVTSLLIDIHGQHDHQSLLKVDKHIKLLDEFARNELKDQKAIVKKAYTDYCNAKKELEEFNLDEEQRIRETEFLEFEINEIESANLSEGEDELIETEFKKISNMKKILESLSVAYNNLTDNSGNNIQNMISGSVQEMASVSNFDEDLNSIYSQLSNIEDLCNDVSREIASYVDEAEYNAQKAHDLEERLDIINHLKHKFGNSIEDILVYLDEKKERLDILNNYSVRKKESENVYNQKLKKLDEECNKLTKLRDKSAKVFSEKVKEVLVDLNFLQVEFEVKLTKSDYYSSEGNDKAEFMISTNPGAPVMSLAKIASGGELSRIMLGIKTIMADADDIDTLIFDEIDTGISGRTAQKVAEQMKILSKNHQIICITHLPQIASMADNHLKIEKTADEDNTVTNIYSLNENDSIEELARMLGGAEITDAVMENAREMKKLALTIK